MTKEALLPFALSPVLLDAAAMRNGLPMDKIHLLFDLHAADGTVKIPVRTDYAGHFAIMLERFSELRAYAAKKGYQDAKCSIKVAGEHPAYVVILNSA